MVFASSIPPIFTNDMVVRLSVSPANFHQIPITFRVKFAIVNKIRETVLQKEHKFGRNNNAMAFSLSNFQLVDVSRREELLVDGADLVIYCEIEIWVGKAKLSGKTENLNEQPLFSIDELIKHYGELFETKKLSDVTLTIRGC